MSEFQKRVELLKTLGAEFHTEYEYRTVDGERGPHNIEVFRSVKPPFTAEELAGLYMSDGQFYMGGCCGQMGALQDLICSEIRHNSGWFKIRKLEEIAEIMISHDGSNKKELTFKAIPEGKTLQDLVDLASKPIKKNQLRKVWWWLALIWHITKDFYNPEEPHGFHENIEEPERAISVLSSCLHFLNFQHLFSNGPQAQGKANETLLFYRMLPALKALNDNISKMTLPPMEGFAIVELEKPEEVTKNGYGYCIFEGKDEAERMFKLWEHSEKEHEAVKSVRERLKLRRVRVSSENGIEFLD